MRKTIREILEYNRKEAKDIPPDKVEEIDDSDIDLCFDFLSSLYPEECEKIKNFLHGNVSRLKNLINLDGDEIADSLGVDSELGALISMMSVGQYLYKYSGDLNTELSNKYQVVHYIGDKVRKFDTEELIIIGIDENNNIADKMVFCGTKENVFVSKENVLKFVKDSPISKVIVSHNHPSGIYEPSVSDIIQTGNIAEAVSHMGVRVVEHLIMCENGVFSFRDNGIIDAIYYFRDKEPNKFAEYIELPNNKLYVSVMQSKLHDTGMTGADKMLTALCFLSYKIFKDVDTREDMIW